MSDDLLIVSDKKFFDIFIVGILYAITFFTDKLIGKQKKRKIWLFFIIIIIVINISVRYI